jgi:pentatricopeptide repeat protein
MNMINPDPGPLRAAVDELVASGFRDPEGLFYQAIQLAHAGDLDRAVEIFADVVKRGFYPYETFMRHAWIDPLRGRQDFGAILEIAQHNHEKAHAAFVNAGGKTLLGIEG